MISVPGGIKRLYEADHAYKNIRIHFPNGERSDICNDLIVKNSVSFKESLCSQNTLKFGLVEAPVFECETVGVGNIKGSKIEVYVEIECPSNVTGAEWRIDLQKNVYSIPYGTFVVDSCKRQADMIHRKIVAYGYNVNNAISNGWYDDLHFYTEGHVSALGHYDNYEEIKNAIPRAIPGVYSFNLIKRLCNRYPTMPIDMFDDVVERASLPGSYFRLEIYPDIYLYITESVFSVSTNATLDDNLYYLERGDMYYTKQELYDTLLPYALDLAERRAADYWQAIHPVSIIKETLKVIFGTTYVYEFRDGIHSSKTISRTVKDPVYEGSMSSQVTWRRQGGYGYTWSIREPLEAFPKQWYVYPYDATDDPDDNYPTYLYFRMYDSFRIQYHENNLEGQTWDVRNSNENKSFLVNTYDVFESVSRKITNIQEYTAYIVDKSFDNSKYSKILNDLFEMRGVIGGVDRFNTIKYINLKKQFRLNPGTALYPGTDVLPLGAKGGKLLPQDYQSCWYDDRYSLLFGTIICNFKVVDPEDPTKTIDSIYTLYLNDFDAESDTDLYQQYDFSNNSIIKSGIWTPSQIQEICEAIAENLDGVTYMPVDFKGRGLPYVEAGDTFEILTKSNDSITTIVLNRTITGEQTLTDSYKSV